MTREIEFRALKDDVSDFKFVYGNLVYDEFKNPYIGVYTTTIGWLHNACIKGSEGQFTGSYDRTGKKIYQGDVVSFWGGLGEVVFADSKFCIKVSDYDFFDIPKEKVLVKGNIHTSPGLLNSNP